MLAGAIAGGVQMGIAAAAGGIHRDAAVGGVQRQAGLDCQRHLGRQADGHHDVGRHGAGILQVMKARLAPDGGVRLRLAVAAGNARAQAQVHAGVAGAFGQPVRQCLGQHALQQARRAFQDGDFGPSARAVDATSRPRKPPPMTATRVWGARPARSAAASSSVRM